MSSPSTEKKHRGQQSRTHRRCRCVEHGGLIGQQRNIVKGVYKAATPRVTQTVRRGGRMEAERNKTRRTSLLKQQIHDPELRTFAFCVRHED